MLRLEAMEVSPALTEDSTEPLHMAHCANIGNFTVSKSARPKNVRIAILFMLQIYNLNASIPINVYNKD